MAGLAAYLLSTGEHPELFEVGSVAQNMKDLIQALAYPRIQGGMPVAFNGIGLSCTRNWKRDGKIECNPANSSSTSTISSTATSTRTWTTSTSATRTSHQTTSASATETATPVFTATPLFTLDNTVTVNNGQKACYSTAAWPMTPGTYGFEFIATDNLVVYIGKDDSEPTYYQGVGSGSGTFYADYSGALFICATNRGLDIEELVWKVYDTEAIETLDIEPPGPGTVYPLSESLSDRQKCFTTGQLLTATYTFSYKVSSISHIPCALLSSTFTLLFCSRSRNKQS